MWALPAAKAASSSRSRCVGCAFRPLISQSAGPGTRGSRVRWALSGALGTVADMSEPTVVSDSPADVRERAESVLRALVGAPDARLRDDQWTAIEAIAVGHRRALVVQRTGWGKSAVYFVATALRRAAGAGPTVIVSPLLALMRNQIEAAERAGIHAVTINSTNPEAWQQTYDDVSRGDVDVLLVSPERLNNPSFRDNVLPDLSRSAGLLVVDEAHCISDWGHDFRPDYRRIRTLLADLPTGIPVLATTATANERVTADVAEQLSVSGTTTLDDVLVLRGDLDRESLHLGVVRVPDQATRLGWLADHLDDLDGSGIIYCLTVAATQDVSAFLRERGHDVRAYSGQTEQAERLAAEEDLMNNRVKALVATSALGMGFDKPDLGFVIHVGAPPSPIAYYQQVGRAGRAVERATVVLMPGQEDRAVWAYFGSLSFPPSEQVRETLDVLAEADGPLSVAALETRVSLRRTRLEMMLKVLDVDGAVRRVRGGWESTGEQWAYDEDRYRRVAQARDREQAMMLDYESSTQCRLEFLRQALDDPDAKPCGRCDNCGALSLSTDVSNDALEAARRWLGKPGVPIDARRMWPSAMVNLGVDLKGKIPPGEQPEPGMAVARMTDLGLGQHLRELFGATAPDGEVPVPLRHALVAVLDGWEWPTGGAPDAIVGIDSITRPTLGRHLCDGLSRYTGWPVVGHFAITNDSEPGQGSTNSAQRLRVVAGRFGLSDPSAVAGRRVLLVDDRMVSGWTLAVTARDLRRAGAEAVFPLVLALDA